MCHDIVKVSGAKLNCALRLGAYGQFSLRPRKPRRVVPRAVNIIIAHTVVGQVINYCYLSRTQRKNKFQLTYTHSDIRLHLSATQVLIGRKMSIWKHYENIFFISLNL